MLAGLDTTSNGLSRILYLLAQNRDSQERLRMELLEARSPVTEPNGANIPHDELMKLPYLDAVFQTGHCIASYLCSAECDVFALKRE